MKLIDDIYEFFVNKVFDKIFAPYDIYTIVNGDEVYFNNFLTHLFSAISTILIIFFVFKLIFKGGKKLWSYLS